MAERVGMSVSSFATDIASTLREARTLAESLMTCTIVVRAKTVETTIDPDTDSEVDVWADLFTSRCKIQDIDPQPIEAEVGARTVVTVRQRVDMPVSSPLLDPGAVGEVTAVGPEDDPALLGVKFEFIAAPISSKRTAHRWPVRRYVS